MKTSLLIKKVENALLWDINCRNSDAYLTLYLWKRVKNQEAYSQDEIMELLQELPPPDIKRVRAHIQNDDGNYIPTIWIIARARNHNVNKWKQALGYSLKTPEDYIEEDRQQIHLRWIERQKN